jgi:TonB family protein
MTARVGTVFLLLVSGSVLLGARASDIKQIEQALNATYKGKIVTLRNSYRGESLRYDAQGKLVKGGPTGPSTVWAHIEVEQMKLQPKGLMIKGTRIFLVPCQRAGLRRARGGRVSIHAEMGEPPASLEALTLLLGRILLTPDERPALVIPDYWKRFCSGESGPKAGGPREGFPMFASCLEKDSAASPPVPIDKPEPPYTPMARSAKVQGAVVLLVGVNAQGNVRDVEVLKPLGYGLDDQAVETVQTWRFKPAICNGVPTPVSVMVEVVFLLLAVEPVF